MGETKQLESETGGRYLHHALSLLLAVLNTAAIKPYKTKSWKAKITNRNNSVKENYHKNKTNQTTANASQNMTHNNAIFEKIMHGNKHDGNAFKLSCPQRALVRQTLTP